MKLTLNVAEDTKLRREVMAVIRSMVDGALREEIKATIATTLSSLGAKISDDGLEKTINKMIADRGKEFFDAGGTAGSGTGIKNAIAKGTTFLLEERAKLIEEKVDEAITAYVEKKFDTTLDLLVDRKVKARLKAILEGEGK